MSVLDGDLSNLSLPADLELLRDQAGAALDQGRSLDALYAALADQAPMALLDLVMGPKALRGEPAVRAALKVLPALESQTSGAAVYKRLADLAPELTSELLAQAGQLHPSAGWLPTLARRWEKALIHEARGGQPRPCAALLAAGATQAATQASAALLAEHPTAALVPELQRSAEAPVIDALLVKLIPRLRSATAARSLLDQASPYPQAQRILRLVLPGMRA